jgi:hypothetical protein
MSAMMTAKEGGFYRNALADSTLSKALAEGVSAQVMSN